MSVIALAAVANPARTETWWLPDRAVTNLTEFNLPEGAALVIRQPSPSATATIHVTGKSIARLQGALHATGRLIWEFDGGADLSPSAQITAEGLVLGSARKAIRNEGEITAKSHGLAISADDVIQRGKLRLGSDSTGDEGQISLDAARDLVLGANSVIEASQGSLNGHGNGGRIRLHAGAHFVNEEGSVIAARGGKQGGDGGVIELCSPNLSGVHSRMDASATQGWKAGQLVLDPLNIVLSATGAAASSGIISENDPPSGTLMLNVASLGTFSQITLQAMQDITLNTAWRLPASADPSSTLVLQAGRDIHFSNGAYLSAGANWSVVLVAGAGFQSPTGVVSNIGSLNLTGSAYVETRNSGIRIRAGKDVSVESGAIRTLAGGGIDVLAQAGNVNSGNNPNGFIYSQGGNGYTPAAALGGISSGAGGDVEIQAGGNVTSYMPLGSTAAGDGGSGAFGPQPGSVKVTAGGGVFGHFVSINGSGHIISGANAGTSGAPLSLSLANGSWDVTAGNAIYFQEVRNPNGTFNTLGARTSPARHRFDYSPQSAVGLAAPSIYISPIALPRAPGELVPAVFPPTLTVQAGSGGLQLGGDIILYPSPSGQLTAATSDGGSFTSAAPGETPSLIISDSGKTQWSAPGDFGEADHSPTPVHTGDSAPASVTINGNLSSVRLSSPKPVRVLASGDILNASFAIQHLAPSDLSSIGAQGKIWNRSFYTYATVDSAPDLAVLAHAIPPTSLLGRLSFDPVTRSVIFWGRMTEVEAASLSALQVQIYDDSGNPLFDGSGQPLTQVVAILDTSVAQQLFVASQDIPLTSTWWLDAAGPGAVNVSAASLDLGNTLGIRSPGPAMNPVLAAVNPVGAAVRVQVAGDLIMPESAIASIAGGDIDVAAGGKMNLGVPYYPADPSVHGIYTTAKANVTVSAQGDIDLTHARIGAFDGGDVRVQSVSGNILAGPGGSSLAHLEEVIVDPQNQAVNIVEEDLLLPYGILATTFPAGASTNPVGNMVIQAGMDLIASSTNNILQFSFNGTHSSGGTLTVTAGGQVQIGIISQQRFEPPSWAPDGQLVIAFHDSSGAAYTEADIPRFQIQASANLVDWATASFALATNATGGLQFTDPASKIAPMRYYRVIGQ